MARFEVQLLGRFCVRYSKETVQGLDMHKVQELICYLLLFRRRPHPRESLANLLYGECSSAQSKKNLRQVLWQLQTALRAAGEPPDGNLILAEHDWVCVNPEADLWLDISAFEAAFSQVQGIRGRALTPQNASLLQEATQLYTGDLLEGWYEDWCLFERERLQNMYLVMLDKLMSYSEAHHDYELGLTYGSRILRQDRARERTHRAMMRLYSLAGDRTTALRQYRRCAKALADELDVAPSAETMALYDQIRSGRIERPVLPPPAVTGPSEQDVLPLHELLGHLRQYHARMARVQQRMEQDIHSVESWLDGRPRRL